MTVVCFFFQAEDGIRDYKVTGVQTCALPILLFAPEAEPQRSRIIREVAKALFELAQARELGRQGMLIVEINGEAAATHASARSEERRVGKESRCGWRS